MIKNVYKFFYAISLFLVYLIVFIVSLIFVILENDLISIIICTFSAIFGLVVPTLLVISGVINKVIIDIEGIRLYKCSIETKKILWDSIINIQLYKTKLSVIEVEYKQNDVDGIIRLDYTNKFIECIKKYIPDDLKTKLTI